MWPTVSYCVPTKYMGLALGLITALVNFGCMITPILIISVKNYMGGVEYIIFQLLFVVLIGMYFMARASFEDAKNEGSINIYTKSQIYYLVSLDSSN